MRFNSKTGFTMIEAILALVVLVLALTPILVMQTTRVRSCSRAARLFDRIQHAMAFMYESAQNETPTAREKSSEKVIQRPAARLTYKRYKPAQNSTLKNFPSIELEQVTITWNEDNTAHTDTVVASRYVPLPQQETA